MFMHPLCGLLITSVLKRREYAHTPLFISSRATVGERNPLTMNGTVSQILAAFERSEPVIESRGTI